MVANWTAVYERQDSGWVAYCAEFPGSGVVGHTLSEARKQLREVMEGLLQRRAEEAAALAGAAVGTDPGNGPDDLAVAGSEEGPERTAGDSTMRLGQRTFAGAA